MDPADAAAGKGSAAAADKADGSGCVEQEGPVFEGDKPRRGAPLVVGAVVVLVVAAVYFLAIKKPKTVETMLLVNSVPDSALIYLDGRNTAHLTPHLFTNITPGHHNLKLTRDGYVEHFFQVQVVQHRTTEVTVTLTPAL